MLKTALLWFIDRGGIGQVMFRVKGAGEVDLGTNDRKKQVSRSVYVGLVVEW